VLFSRERFGHWRDGRIDFSDGLSDWIFLFWHASMFSRSSTNVAKQIVQLDAAPRFVLLRLRVRDYLSTIGWWTGYRLRIGFVSGKNLAAHGC